MSNAKRSDGKRSFLYVLARTKEQCIEHIQEICKQHKQQGYCSLTIADLFYERHRSILHQVKESTDSNFTMKAGTHILLEFRDQAVSIMLQPITFMPLYLKKKAGFSPWYITDIVILMKVIFKYAVRTFQIFYPLDSRS